MDTIVKVQIEQSGTRALIYNEDMTILYEGDATDFVKQGMTPMSKAYFEATLKQDGLLDIGDQVEEQPW